MHGRVPAQPHCGAYAPAWTRGTEPRCKSAGPMGSASRRVTGQTASDSNNGPGMRGAAGRACVAGVGVPVPPDEVRDAGVPPVVGGALVVHVPGHVLQHGDVVRLRAALVLLSASVWHMLGTSFVCNPSAFFTQHMQLIATWARRPSARSPHPSLCTCSGSHGGRGLQHVGHSTACTSAQACSCDAAHLRMNIPARTQAAVRPAMLVRMHGRHRAAALQRQRPWAP